MKSSACVVVLVLVASVAGADNKNIATEPKDVDPTLGQAPRVTSKQAMLASSSTEDLMSNLNNLVQGVCRDQSGTNCDDIDWTGQSDWYKKYFIQYQPLQITNSLGPPSVPKDSQILSNTTASVFYCPPRDFKYICQLDKQYFEQTVKSTTSSHGWNFGTTTKISAVFGVSFLGNGGGAGPVLQFSFSYSFQDATTEAHAEQETTVESVAVTVPANSKCLKIRTELSKIDASGTQSAYITASNWIGLHQNDKHHWKWDSDPNEKHYYRAATLGYLVSLAQQAGVAEAKDWTVVDSNTANIVIPINLKFNLGTSGRTYNDWYDVGSPECNDIGPSALRAEKPVATKKLASGEEIPVFKAVRRG